MDLNVLLAGLDTNYADANHRDPWGAQPIAVHIPKADSHATDNWSAYAMSMFGRAPDFFVDIDGALSDRQLRNIIQAAAPCVPMCIQPFENGGLWSEGWLGIMDGENIQQQYTPSVSVYGFCQRETMEDLILRTAQTNTLVDESDAALMCQTCDLVSILTYITYNGRYINPTAFDVTSHATDISITDRCRLVLSQGKLLDQKQESQLKISKENDPMQTPSTDPVDIMELDGYLSSDSDFVNNGTFDAVLQKSKDYPIDWWQGGSECMLAVDDINCKAMTRAAVRWSVRWLLFGFIAFAVPKALGWEEA